MMTTAPSRSSRGIFDELCLRAEAKGGAIHPSKVDGMTTYSSYYIRSHCHVTPYLSEILALTIPDIMEQKHFDDAICTFVYAVDIHDPNGNGGCGYFCSACHFDPAGRGHQGLKSLATELKDGGMRCESMVLHLGI